MFQNEALIPLTPLDTIDNSLRLIRYVHWLIRLAGRALAVKGLIDIINIHIIINIYRTYHTHTNALPPPQILSSHTNQIKWPTLKWQMPPPRPRPRASLPDGLQRQGRHLILLQREKRGLRSRRCDNSRLPWSSQPSPSLVQLTDRWGADHVWWERAEVHSGMR